MQVLIDQVARKTGLEPERAERAVGLMLFLIRKQGDRQKVDELFAKLPGAEELAASHRKDLGHKGGLRAKRPGRRSYEVASSIPGLSSYA